MHRETGPPRLKEAGLAPTRSTQESRDRADFRFGLRGPARGLQNRTARSTDRENSPDEPMPIQNVARGASTGGRRAISSTRAIIESRAICSYSSQRRSFA